MAAKKADPNNKTIAENRRARFDYAVEDTFEAGIVLCGTEVKALREGRANIAESYVAIEGENAMLINANIPIYPPAKLMAETQRKGRTIVPLKMYFNNKGIAKLLIGIATGKDNRDKRDTQKKRDWQRDKARIMRERG